MGRRRRDSSSSSSSSEDSEARRLRKERKRLKKEKKAIQMDAWLGFLALSSPLCIFLSSSPASYLSPYLFLGFRVLRSRRSVSIHTTNDDTADFPPICHVLALA